MRGFFINDLFNTLVEDLEDSLQRRLQFRTQIEPRDFKWQWELPGVKKEEITITHDGEYLHLKVDSKIKKLSEDWRLPSDNFNIDEIKAVYHDGLLEIEVPKRGTQRKEQKLIEIK